MSRSGHPNDLDPGCSFQQMHGFDITAVDQVHLTGFQSVGPGTVICDTDGFHFIKMSPSLFPVIGVSFGQRPDPRFMGYQHVPSGADTFFEFGPFGTGRLDR